MDVQTYLLHSGLILTLLSIFYWLLLRRETFFKANRWLLLGTILLALVIPLLPKPAYVIQLKADLVESFQPAKIESPVVNASENIPTENPSISPQDEAIDLENTPVEVADIKPAPISFKQLLNWGYLIGFCIMLFRFLVQIFSVYQQIKRSEVTKGAGYYLATNNKDIAPFSFWKYIVINPNKYDETSFIQILEHERIHIIQRHTFDLVVAELFLMVQWFNPLAWWHRHLIGQNLEFLVDQTLLDNGENKQAYQYHLVQVAVPNSPLSISSNYNASQLKNRIKMMNLQRSSLAASWKYALLLPITFLLLVAFTTQTGPNVLQKQQVNNLDALYIVITEDAKIADIKKKQEALLKYGANLIFEDLQYNTDNKIESAKVFLHVDNTFGSANWTKEKEGYKALILYKDWTKQSLGTGFSEELFEVIENRPTNSKIFVVGGENTTLTLNRLKDTAQKAKEDLLAKQQKLQDDPAWKGEWFTETINFSECSTYMLEQLKMEFLNSTKTTYTFRVNGIEWDERALEIPAESIGAYTVTDEGYALPNEHGLPSRTNRKVTKRVINIIRKAQPTIKEKSDAVNLEEIFIILTEEASLEELKEAQEKLLDLGVKLTLNNIEYDQKDQRIESISVTYEAGGNSGIASWKNDQSYNFITFSWNPKTGNTAVGNGDLMKIKTSNLNDSQLFIMGKENNAQAIDFLYEKMKFNQRLAKAKLKQLASNPDWKGSLGKASSSYTNITPRVIAEIKEKIQSDKVKKVVYKVDGIEWGAEALNIPIAKIEQISLFERNRTKFNEQEEIVWEITEQLEVIISRKIQKEKSKAKKDYQYFKECDCQIPKTFSPNGGKNKFKIEGGKINGNSSFQVYDRWGEKVYDATPFNNDWNGEDDYETVLKEATYYYVFQANETTEVVQAYFKVVENKKQNDANDFSFDNDSYTPHYIIIPSTQKSLSKDKKFLKNILSNNTFNGKKLKLSQINIGKRKKNPALVIEKFENAAEASKTIHKIGENYPNILSLLPISQSNYEKLLQKESIEEYTRHFIKRESINGYNFSKKKKKEKVETIDKNTIKHSTDFVHQPDTTHYLIIPCTAEDFEATKNMIKPSLFMLGMAKTKRYSNIYLGSDKNKPLFIIRKFDNFEQAEQLRINFKNINPKLPNLKILSINQHNYRQILQQNSIVEYEKFYKAEILK